jgi:hypothetical protein
MALSRDGIEFVSSRLIPPEKKGLDPSTKRRSGRARSVLEIKIGPELMDRLYAIAETKRVTVDFLASEIVIAHLRGVP